MPDPSQQVPSHQDPSQSPSSPSPSKDQQQAAGDLKKAGEKVASSGDEMQQAGEPSASSNKQPPELPQDPLMPPETGSDEPDPLMPEGEGTDWMMGDTGSLSDEIRAAQEALQTAGIALQTAGDTLEHAATDDELAAAGEALAKARIAIIVAGQDLIAARDIAEGSDPGMEEIINNAEDALNDANVVIVVATNSILSSRIELPQSAGSSSGGGRMGELDKELEESMVIFEGEILEARRSVIDSTPPPTTNASIPGPVVMGGRGSKGEDEPSDDQGMQTSEETQQGRMQGSKGEISVASVVKPPPEDVPDPQGDDIVAQQLREAATVEADPELQAKLWEEYKRYRAGL
jgi:hypothetical protein